MDQNIGQPDQIPKAPPIPQSNYNIPAGQTGPEAGQYDSQKSDTLGIVSIVMAFVGMQLIGLILGIIGARKAKQEGRSSTLSTVGWVLNLIFLVLAIIFMVAVFAAIPSMQNNARETSSQNNMAVLAGEIEKFHFKNGYYPQSLDELGRDVNIMSPSGKPYEYTPSPKGCTKCERYDLTQSP